MGTVIDFPRKRSTAYAQPAEPKVKSELVISTDPPGPPAEEFKFGYQEASFVAFHQIASREEFLALSEARRSGPVPFLRQIQACAFVQREPAAAAAPLGEFSAYIHGRYGGGVRGAYASGYRAAFAVLEPFVRNLH
ncbi:hypothetical protein [Methylobacterium sp. Leaf118]|uniref:hypothetical protein n=1 Tax=Methylobacterium sp. Leaf118 TaxID=2876562 RepID=UPI001E388186|nr:hypothetical protein [Methylobacterium sp. Leaf118]